MIIESRNEQKQSDATERKKSRRRSVWYAFLLLAVAGSAIDAEGMPLATVADNLGNRGANEAIASGRLAAGWLSVVDSAERVVAPGPDTGESVATEERRVAVRSVSTESIFLIGSNPVRGPTSIDFALPRSGHTSLILLDAQGKQVATLLDEDLASGNHTVQWNPTGVGAGVYILMLRNDGYVETDMVEIVPMRTRSRGIGAFRP